MARRSRFRWTGALGAALPRAAARSRRPVHPAHHAGLAGQPLHTVILVGAALVVVACAAAIVGWVRRPPLRGRIRVRTHAAGGEGMAVEVEVVVRRPCPDGPLRDALLAFCNGLPWARLGDAAHRDAVRSELLERLRAATRRPPAALWRWWPWPPRSPVVAVHITRLRQDGSVTGLDLAARGRRARRPLSRPGT